MKIRTAVSIAFFSVFPLACADAQPACISFPSNFVPFSSISYVTAANSVGDHLVVGVPAPGLLNLISANVPVPTTTNQAFCDAQVQLAPQQLFSNVYVPTASERTGIFSAFAGLFVNPATNLAYPNGVIPSNQLSTVFAWRIGAAQASTSNRNWSATRSMGTGRLDHASVLLPTGKVLVLSFGTAEIYDPDTGTFAFTSRPLFAHGNNASMVVLNDGRVLIVGGITSPSASEFYDPSTGVFTAGPSTIQPHGWFHTSTLLNNGRVLIVGGLAQTGAGNPMGVGDTNASAEVFDPAAATFTATASPAVNRNSHTATLLSDGRVLIAGGYSKGGSNDVPNQVIFNTAEIFDPSSGAFSPAGSMQATRAQFFAVLLPNGKVLLGGGRGTGLSTAELFDPVTRSFTPTGGMTTARNAPSAVVLSDGEALVAGGDNAGPGQTATSSAELYNPASGIFTPTGNMVAARTQHRSTLLLDGRVFTSGGTPACCQISLASAEIYTPANQGLVTSQSGLTFRVAQSSSGLPTQSVAVLSSTDPIPWTISTHTYQGGNWLVVSPASGNSVPGATPVNLTIGANAAGLAAQDYYGTVTLTPTDGKHPPVSIGIVLSIVPAGKAAPPIVAPTGLLFIGAPGASPASQTFTISNLTSTPLSFSTIASANPKWFNSAPASGAVNGGQTASITVSPSSSGLAAGVYPGSIQLNFGDGSTQIVQLILVLSPTAVSGNARAESFGARATAACTPTRLLPLFTSLGTGFNTTAAWGAAIVVQVTNDCGALINSGSVIVSFSNGDPPIALLSTGSGIWTGTWVPQHDVAGITARADAVQPPLTGSVAVSGQVPPNPSVPVVTPGGVVSSGDYAGAPALGLLVSIFGSGLADSGISAPVPLPPQLGTTQVLLGKEALPLLYVSDSLINALIPYDLPVNTGTQLLVQRANTISVPVTTTIFDASPSVLSTAATGSGQGHVYVIGEGGIETLADQNHPAKAGDNVVIYCIGLGAVAPGIVGGQIALSDPLSKATASVTVTFGTQTVAAGFAGLTPDETGLYQINTSIPAGVTPGNQVLVTIAAGGASSSAQIFMVIQ